MKKYFVVIIVLLFPLMQLSLAQDAVIEIQNKPLHKINKFIYGNFVEFLGGSDGGFGAAWDDAKDDFRADVVQKLKELHAPIIRFPGGCFADTYHWKDGVGDRKKRKSKENLAWKGSEPNKIGTDEFLQLCKRINTEPQFTVNFGSGTPEEAAAWLEYTNKQKNYGVKYWEIGNEIYGGWETGHTTAYNYAKRFLEYARQMKKVDKNIKLIAVGDGTIFFGSKWNQKVLKIAGSEIDYLSLHFYMPGLATNLQGDELYYHIQAQADVLKNYLLQTKQIIDSTNNKHVKIAVTEWNVGFPTYMDYWEENLAAAVFAGGFLNQMERLGDFVEIANFAQLVNTNWSITAVKAGKDKVYATPGYCVLKMYAEHTGEFLLPVNVKSETFREGEKMDVAYIDAAASVDEGHVYLHVVNRHLKKALTASIKMGGLNVKKDASVFSVSADSVEERNTFDEPEKVKIQSHAVINAGQSFPYTFPAHSVTIIEMTLEK